MSHIPRTVLHVFRTADYGSVYTVTEPATPECREGWIASASSISGAQRAMRDTYPGVAILDGPGAEEGFGLVAVGVVLVRSDDEPPVLRAPAEE